VASKKGTIYFLSQKQCVWESIQCNFDPGSTSIHVLMTYIRLSSNCAVPLTQHSSELFYCHRLLRQSSAAVRADSVLVRSCIKLQPEGDILA